MAYTPVPEKNTGDTWTAADHNTYVRDNFAAGVPDIFTAKGDLAAATAADVAGVLAIGADGALLTAAAAQATGLSWATPNTARVYAKYKVSATRALANATATIVNFDTSVFDTNSAVTTGAAWKFTAPTTGYYAVACSLLLESNAGWAADEYFASQLFYDGAVYTVVAEWIAQATGTYTAAVSGLVIIYIEATHYIDIRGYQTSGGAINVAADGDYSHVAIARLF